MGDAFDFVAVHVIPEEVWYIIPAEKVRGQGSVALYPRLARAKYAPYKEAWELLRGGSRIPSSRAGSSHSDCSGY
ncbi:MAG TPA: hypothetical protein VH088_07410 [Terriglobales bacterium]|nr:hypothetical protein [Terriglobales bacterium]